MRREAVPDEVGMKGMIEENYIGSKTHIAESKFELDRSLRPEVP